MNTIAFTLDSYMEREFRTVTETANFLGVSNQTIYNAIDSGELPARKFTPKLFRLRTIDVLRWAGISLQQDGLPDQSGNKMKEADL